MILSGDHEGIVEFQDPSVWQANSKELFLAYLQEFVNGLAANHVNINVDSSHLIEYLQPQEVSSQTWVQRLVQDDFLVD